MMERLFHFATYFLPAQLPPDEQRKRSFLVLFQFLLCPVLIFFAVFKNTIQGFTFEVVMIYIGALLSIIVLFSLRHLVDLLPLFRMGAAYIVLLAIYEVAIGSGEGSAFLWFYFYPLSSLFIFGKREGIWWIVLGLAGILAVMVLDLGPYHYMFPIALRFGFSYLVVSLLSFGLEESRERYYTALDAEKLALERALAQVQTLQMLMPICASCKKIRDDQGYWHDVETYISNQIDVEFSQAICPNCTSKLAPN